MKFVCRVRHARRVCVGVAVLTTVLYGHAFGQHRTSGLRQGLVVEAVESVAAVVDREYFDADVAARVALSIRERLSQGRYDDAPTLESLSETLTRDLFEATKDKHLAVRVVQVRSSAQTSDDRAVRARRTNFGLQRVEVLAGNVGYLNLTSFYRPEEARDALSAAMRLLQSTDALILDMRENSGGSPDTVALLTSYLFDAPRLPLFEIVPRAGTGRQYATEDPPVPERSGTRPVYVLTAERTFSAGEGFAFILQERRRALVVGERTAGAANPARPYAVSARLEVTVPNGRIRTAISGRNWEGNGVTPDVSVPATDALRLARIHALRELLTQVPSGSWQQTLKRQLEALELLNRR